MSFRLGLTGSIGMGKSTTARIFADLGCDVWDADAAVHRLYAQGGAAVTPIGALFPEAIRDQTVDRGTLKEIIGETPGALKQIEAIVHPLVANDRQKFIENSAEEILVFDIPLLFETGGNQAMDAVACVSVSPEIQKMRVLERGSMTEAQFQTILEKQISIKEKMARSDYVITTDTLDHARAQVIEVLADIKRRMADA